MERHTILIVTDENEFADAVVACWPTAEQMPSFIVRTGRECGRDDFDVAVAGSLNGSAASVLETLRRTTKPVIFISPVSGTAKLAGAVALPEVAGWPELLTVLTREILGRLRAESELAKLQESQSQLEHRAALGEYMLEARHNLSNVLTSILGNCDLILLDDDQLSPTTRGQVETIRNMGMRLNEIMQRFSSLQKEMQLVEQQSRKPAATSIAAGAGLNSFSSPTQD